MKEKIIFTYGRLGNTGKRKGIIVQTSMDKNKKRLFTNQNYSNINSLVLSIFQFKTTTAVVFFLMSEVVLTDFASYMGIRNLQKVNTPSYLLGT